MPFEQVNPQLEQAARMLGLNEWAVFCRVSLPLAWRGILAGVLLAFARALGEFGATLMVAGSIPNQTQTLSIAVYEAVQAGQEDLRTKFTKRPSPNIQLPSSNTHHKNELHPPPYRILRKNPRRLTP